FIDLFPMILSTLGNGGILLLDELDTDLHPLLIPELLYWFYDPVRNPHKAQLLFSAHNASLLDELEKEQVFFTEKPMGKATQIYGAKDIGGLRREPSLTKKYLSGELGAIPQIG
ncbi:MAG: abortive infection protein, partial [Hyphomonadaceae bacterium]